MNNEQQLFLENEKLIHFVLKDIHTNKIEYEDLESIGRIGLWKACTSYDSQNGMFSTYSVECIKNEIYTELNKFKQEKRNFECEPFSSFEEHEIESATEYPLNAENSHLTEEIAKQVEILAKNSLPVVDYFKGLKTQSEIAKELGVNKQNISRKCKRFKKRILKQDIF